MSRLPHVSVFALLGFFVLVAGSPAQAVTMSCNAPTKQATLFSLGHSTAAACFSGNDSNDIDSAFPMFGMTGWVLADKNETPHSGDGTIKFSSAPINGQMSGNWTIDTLAGLTKIVVTLKAGNGFGAFLLDLTVNNPLTGNWTSGKMLSHASIYYNGTPTTTVPLPAGLPLFAGALGLLGIAGWQRRRKSGRGLTI